MTLSSQRPLASALGLCLLLGAGACKPRPQPAGLAGDGRPAERLADEAARDYKSGSRDVVRRYNAWATEATRTGGPPLRIAGEVTKVKRVKNAPGKRWLVLRNDAGVEVALLGEVHGSGGHAVGEVSRASSRKGRLVFVCRSITLSKPAGAGGPAPPPAPVEPPAPKS